MSFQKLWANKGFKVHLVEKDDKLGGQLNLIYKINFDRIDSKEFLEKKLKEFNEQKNIIVYLNSEVTNVKGSIGDFKVTVKNNAEGKDADLNVGTIIAATGAFEYKPEGWYHNSCFYPLCRIEATRRR
jgi:heterodisulfide reductase subunit A